MDKTKEEIRSLDLNQLGDKLAETRRGLLSLRLNSAATHVKDYSQFKKLRRQIALILTYINQGGFQKDDVAKNEGATK